MHMTVPKTAILINFDVVHSSALLQGVLDWTTSTRLSASTICEFQTSAVSRALVLHVGFR